MLCADVRDLVSVADVMEELDFGPNGGLVYAMEFLTKNMDWLEEELERYGDDDYLILDCPGAHTTPHVPTTPVESTDARSCVFVCVAG